MTKIDDSEIRRKVIAELDWDPSIDASGVGVAVKGGVVTLNGSIASYWQKKEVDADLRCRVEPNHASWLDCRNT